MLFEQQIQSFSYQADARLLAVIAGQLSLQHIKLLERRRVNEKTSLFEFSGGRFRSFRRGGWDRSGWSVGGARRQRASRIGVSRLGGVHKAPQVNDGLFRHGSSPCLGWQSRC